MVHKRSVKVSEDGLSFLRRFRNNRIKAESDSEPIPYWEAIEIIANYFKSDNVKYMELVRLDGIK